jgi:hypothetical protein
MWTKEASDQSYLEALEAILIKEARTTGGNRGGGRANADPRYKSRSAATRASQAQRIGLDAAVTEAKASKGKVGVNEVLNKTEKATLVPKKEPGKGLLSGIKNSWKRLPGWGKAVGGGLAGLGAGAALFGGRKADRNENV